jgi:hypothetical protein
MHKTKITLSKITLSTIALLFVGCSTVTPVKEPKKVIVVPKKAQELSISMENVSETIKNKIEYKYTINLNNTTDTESIITLKNRGEKPLTISNITLKDPSHLLKSSNNCSQALKANQTCTLNVKFTSQEKGHFTSTLQIFSDDVKHETTNILINMTAKDKFHGSVKAVQSTKVKQEKTLKLKFNALNRTQYIQVKNDGLATLALNTPKESGENAESFKYTTDCPTSLKVGEKCEVTVIYDPTKKEGYSDATITIPSNGNITPSRYIRLEGYSKPFSIKINKFIVSKNVNNFIDDYFDSSKTYYFRTIYQEDTDRFFTNGIKSEIAQYFKANNFKLASSAATADRVITIYPSIKTTKNEKSNDMVYNIVINGFLTTKAKNIKIDSTSNDITLDYKSTISNTKFSAITLNDSIFSKEKFQFGMNIQVDNLADDKEVAVTVADLVVSKLFNVLGLKDTKGSN